MLTWAGIGDNFWLECPTNLRSTFLSCIFRALFRDTPHAHVGRIYKDVHNIVGSTFSTKKRKAGRTHLSSWLPWKWCREMAAACWRGNQQRDLQINFNRTPNGGDPDLNWSAPRLPGNAKFFSLCCQEEERRLGKAGRAQSGPDLGSNGKLDCQ